jgi:hypothetical protein
MNHAPNTIRIAVVIVLLRHALRPFASVKEPSGEKPQKDAPSEPLWSSLRVANHFPPYVVVGKWSLSSHWMRNQL